MTAVPTESISPRDGDPLAPPRSPLERLRFVTEVLRAEAAALERAARASGGAAVGPAAVLAAERIAETKGAVVVTGIGKAGWVGQKVAATLASTGTPAHFLHPAEALHGDLGRVGPRDLVWAFSYSGRSEEVVRLLPALKEQSAGTLAMTRDTTSPLARWADVLVALGHVDEACPLGLAPSTSTTLMLAVGDAISLLASRLRGFTARDFARFHPGGALGQKLARVEQLMRDRSCCRIARETETVREVMIRSREPGPPVDVESLTDAPQEAPRSRRTGAVMLVDAAGRLVGIFTDSDLARVLERHRDDLLDAPIAEVMTRRVQTVPVGTLLREAIAVLAGRKISELPVVDAENRPLGLLDITDVVGLAEAAPGDLDARRADDPPVTVRLVPPNASA